MIKMQENDSEPYSFWSNYNDRCKGITGECLNVSFKHFTGEIIYLYFRTCFSINPKLLLASILETTHLTITTLYFSFKKSCISSLVKKKKIHRKWQNSQAIWSIMSCINWKVKIDVKCCTSPISQRWVLNLIV